jgi:radical SAM superfamily enzyme YgiQ (UPF0313 family)
MKPVETVVREIREYEKYNKSAFAGYFRKSYFFVDDNLYVNREYTKKLFAAMAGRGVRWDGQGTLNTANDDEVLKLMAASGCRSFSIGFESVSQKSLEEANKPKYNVVSSYSGAVAKIQKHGMVAGGYFVMGFDSDEVTIFQDTRDFIYSARLFLVFVNLLTPYPGTALHERYEAARKIFSMSWECYNSWTCLITPKRMSSLDLQNGFYWLCNQAISIENMKRNVSAFWDISSWADKKTLTLKERIVLLLICLKLQTRKEKSYSKFLVWAATRRNAKDVEFIMWCTLRFELNENRPIREPYNPADKRRELAAGRAG